MSFLTAALRFLRTILALIAWILVLAIITTGALAYLTLTGQDLTALRAVAGRLGTVLSGQQTVSLTLNVATEPERGSFAASSDLVMRSVEDGRGRFYFLLNEGMRVNRVSAKLAERVLSPNAYRIGPLLVVNLGEGVAAEQTFDMRIEYAGAPTSGTLGSSLIFEPRLIRLPPDSLWYPSDAQSFFSADVTVAVPNGMTLVHNGEPIGDAQRGNLHATRWRTTRPIAGMALVAGPYEEAFLDVDGVRYRLFTAPEERLDVGKVIALIAEADAILRSKLGQAGFPQVTAFVSHRLRRAFNDGSGIVGLSNRYFRAGDYGFGLLAHELAHNWWGATIAEKWLSPGTGGEWLVEGFAEFSSIVAAETKYGTAAATQRLTAAFYDPAKQRVINHMSVFDNAVAEDVSRDTIYRKGAYVAYMLRHIIGEPRYSDALTQFLDRFRYRQVSDTDMQKTLEELTGLDLAAYFDDWVRSDKLADLAVDKTTEGLIEVTNLGTARIPGDISLWRFRADGEREAVRVKVGDRLKIDPGIDHVILDPLLDWADVERENNRYPRRPDPVAVAVAPDKRILAAFGAPFAWVRSTVREVSTADGAGDAWDFNRGLTQPPRFGDNADIAVVAEAEAAPLGSIATLSPDGARRILGHGESPQVMPDGSIVAAAEDQLVRWLTDGTQRLLLHRPGFKLDRPIPSHAGDRVAYVSHRGNDLEIRAYEVKTGADASILSWDGDKILQEWSADDTHFYVALGVGWDWQIWAVPLDSSQPTRTLVADAVSVADMSLSPDGTQLAFAAVPALEYPLNRHRLYVQPVDGGAVRTFDMSGDVEALTWETGTTLIVVARQWDDENPWILPATRELQRVRLDDGSVSDL